jgi:cytochrome c oxidase subunit 2
MNHTAFLIAVGYSALVLLSLVVFFVIFRSTRAHHRPPIDETKMTRRETYWFWIVGVGLVALLALTIFDTPWRAAAEPNRQIVNVTGQQFGWAISQRTLQASRQIEFRLRSKDVNHGFAVYDPQGRFVAQAQVIPDNVVLLRITLTKPGVYTVRCLEYCGVDHHLMVANFRVVA